MKSPSFHLVLMLIFAVTAITGYGFWYAAVSNKSGEVATLQNKIAVASADVSRIASAHAAIAEIAGDEAQVQSYFVSEADVVTFITDLENLGLSQKATVKVLSVATKQVSSRATLQLSLTVKGTFDAVMRTIGIIEYAPYDVWIETLSVSQDAKDSWHADLTISAGSVPPSAAASTGKP